MKERERNTHVREKRPSVASHSHHQDLARGPDMCPDQESNRGPFALWDDTQPTEPHSQGCVLIFKKLAFCPGRCDWEVRASSCAPKGRGFDSQSGHAPGLRVSSLCVRETTHRCFSR